MNEDIELDDFKDCWHEGEYLYGDFFMIENGSDHPILAYNLGTNSPMIVQDEQDEQEQPNPNGSETGQNGENIQTGEGNGDDNPSQQQQQQQP